MSFSDILEILIFWVRTKPLDQIDGAISRLHLRLVIDVLRNQSESWKEIIFDKVANFTGANQAGTSIEERNEKLMAKWLLPKLAASLRYTKLNESKERTENVYNCKHLFPCVGTPFVDKYTICPRFTQKFCSEEAKTCNIFHIFFYIPQTSPQVKFQMLF